MKADPLKSLWAATFSGWIMIVKADRRRDAQRIANRSVDSFGGIPGVDIPYVRPATEEDVDWYRAMGGTV